MENNQPMNLDFTLSEFNISGDPISNDIADALLHYHILPMQTIRDIMGIPITASQKSGYRPVKWELAHGRSGDSQHTFKPIPGQEPRGAVDWTCLDFSQHKQKFLNLIIRHTKYTRIAMYDSFFHCDYKPTKSGNRELYQSDAASNWTFLKFV